MQYKKAAIWLTITTLSLIIIILGYFAYNWITYQETVFAEGDEAGNMRANLIYSGIAAEKGDWIYYRNPEDNFYLYKMKKNGADNTKIVEDRPYNINVAGDWIYYTSEFNYGRLYKIKTDGTERTELNQDKTDYVYVKGDWVYYVSVGNKFAKLDYQLRKMKLDGSSKEDILEANYLATKISYPNITEDAIYFVSPLGDYHILKTTLEGENMEIVGQDPSFYINVIGDWIYYVNGKDSKLYKIKVDGSERTKIHEDETGTIHVRDGWIYYNNYSDNGKIYKVKTDGSGKTLVADANIYNLNIAGDWLYGFVDKYGEIKRVQIDRTEVVLGSQNPEYGIIAKPDLPSQEFLKWRNSAFFLRELPPILPWNF